MAETKRLDGLQEVLAAGNAGRQRRLKLYLHEEQRDALAASYAFFRDSADSFATSQSLEPIWFLPLRLAEDVGAALEAWLAGLLAVASDVMRDVIEVDLLLRDFRRDPEQIGQWLGWVTREDDRNSPFKPSRVRSRLAKALGLQHARQLPHTVDYAAHSQLLHVGVPLLFGRGHVGVAPLVR